MILELDCHSVVTKLCSKGQGRSSIWPIIEEAREVGGQLRSLAIKISIVQNNLAYELAQFAKV